MLLPMGLGAARCAYGEAVTKLERFLRNEVQRFNLQESCGRDDVLDSAVNAREMLKEYLERLEQERTSQVILTYCMEVVNEAAGVVSIDDESESLPASSHEHGDGCGVELEALRVSLLNLKNVMEILLRSAKP
jgi:hypothetical protein